MLRVHNLRKTFGSVVALDHVSISFPSRGCFAVIGPNGSGKTTLLNVLTGFVRADAGRCTYRNINLNRLLPHKIARKGIARTFQEVRLVRHVSCLDNLLLARRAELGKTVFRAIFSFTAENERAGKFEASTLLHSVGLGEKASELAGELSYGEQKLLSLLCVQIARPEVALFDEPFSGLHPMMIAIVEEQLKKLSDGGCLVGFIEHDMGAVSRLADHVIVMSNGKVLAEGATGPTLSRSDVLEAYIG